MKGRWISIITLLVLVNYLLISTVANLLAGNGSNNPTPTRTPMPTYTADAARVYVTATPTRRATSAVTATVRPVSRTPTPTSSVGPNQESTAASVASAETSPL